MPTRDIYHEAVKNALIKDGWVITHDPLHVKYGGFDFFVDLGAESLLGACKDGRYIAVEVKSFVGASSLNEFHVAVGQFANYRLVLAQVEPERTLYLAVTEYIYDSFFATMFGQLAIEAHQLKLIVFDEEQEVIQQWLPQTIIERS
jgi:hypothetical protein